ncbi:VPS35 endosomal protein-sorting factor-like isoform X2 [Rhodnius prolixus]|uniref:VPS35 endosomal protein-sorting factor-like isoform X2 n=1 Tax=Rhodnius prolixus TaxID=13249 RepID=UPI003D18A012
MNIQDRLWEWECLVPKRRLQVFKLPRTEIFDHPLKPAVATAKLEVRGFNTVGKNNSAVSHTFINDPLLSAMDGVDPLSALAAQTEFDDIEIKVKKKSEEILSLWKEQRLFILNKYTTANKLSINAGIISHKEYNPPFSQNDSSKLRLEDVDDIFSKDITYLTPQEYVESINELNNELVKAWHQDFRVKALKIAIQSAKFLVDTSVVSFYPSKFVLITDILDVFGNLIYERLWNKADYRQDIPGTLAITPNANSVSESAKETCRNWFYKIASIRELIPRLYVEATALKSYSFLTNSEFVHVLKKLITMVRGIGDPLVAVYTRCYLSRVGISLPNMNSSFAKDNLTDFLLTYNEIFRPNVQSDINKHKFDMPTYLNSFVPAVDWLLKDAANKASEAQLNDILCQCCKKQNKGLLLNSILSTFQKDYIASKAEYFIEEIAACLQDPFPLHILVQKLGECLQQRSVSKPDVIIRHMWKIISHLNNLSEYLSCVLAWNSFIVRYCSLNEVNNLLDEIIMQIGTDVKSCYPAIQDIMIGVVNNFPEPDLIFTMDKFLPLLDLLASDIKADTCRKILEFFAFHPNNYSTTDPVTTNALIFIAKILHDSVNILTVEDEKRQIGDIISKIIRKIKFTYDFEKQLAFYVDARETFINLDFVAITLIHCVNKLAMETGKKVRSHHTKKTASFVHACAAFSFITIPSIRSEKTRLQLYLVTAQTALFNQCLGQADACIKIALLLLLELPHSFEIDGKVNTNEYFLEDYVKHLLSTLIVFPDCPEQGVLYLTRGLINVLNEYTNDKNVHTITKLYLNVLDMLCTVSQPEYPYHIKKVDSNDILYGSDPKFLREINKMCGIIMERISVNIHNMNLKHGLREQFCIITVKWSGSFQQTKAPGAGKLAACNFKTIADV